MPSKQSLVGSTTHTPPEEKGKTLDQKLDYHDNYVLQDFKWDDTVRLTKSEWFHLMRQRDTVWKEYYANRLMYSNKDGVGYVDQQERIARIEEELNDYREALQKIARPALGGKEQQWIAQEILAKHTTSSPTAPRYQVVDRRPVWDLGNGHTEPYTHQDENYSNLCAARYCRCQS